MPTLQVRKPASEMIWLTVILLMAAFVRFVGLTRDSLWTDETFSGYSSQIPTFSELMDFIVIDVHPPGYFTALWAWAKVFGSSDYSLRAFSAVGGLLLVVVVFRLGKQVYGSSTGLIAAFFSAFLIQGIYYSQEVRAYIWIALFSALSVSVLIDWMRNPSPLRLGGFIFVCTLNSYFHYFGLLFSATLIIGWFIRELTLTKRVFAPVLAGVLVVGLFSPWLPIVFASTGKTNWIPRPTPRYVLEVFNILYGPGFMLVGIAGLVLLAGFLVPREGTKPKVGTREKWLIAWIVMPVLVSVAISIIQRPVYTPRNLILAFAAGSLLLARAVTLLSNQNNIRWGVAVATIVAMFGVHAVKGSGYLLRPVKQDVRGVAKYVVDRNLEGLPVLALGWDIDNFVYYFHGTDQAGHLKLIPEELVSERGLRSAAHEPEFWIVSAGIDIRRIGNIEKSFTIEDRVELKEARAYRLRRKESTAAKG